MKIRKGLRWVFPCVALVLWAALSASHAFAASESPRFQVNGFRFAGHTVFESATLERIVSDAIGRQATLDDLQSFADRVTQVYRNRGYLVARAILPAQEIRDGIVTIQVMEGRYGEIVLDNESALRDDVAQSYLRSVQPGTVIHQSGIGRAALLLDDLPGVDALVSLSAGSKAGESDVRLTLRDDRRSGGRLTATNHGNPFTGALQVKIDYELDNLAYTGRGDRLALSATKSGFQSGSVRYTVPVGGAGATVDFSFSSVDYQLGGAFSALDAGGGSRSLSGELGYPLIRSSNANLRGSVLVSAGRMQERVVAVDSPTEKSVYGVTLGINGDRTLADGGLLAFGAQFSKGRLVIESANAEELDAKTARSAGPFTRLSVNGALLYPVTPLSTLTIALRGQLASKNLDSSEKMALGGPGAVRAYPVGALSGDQGWLAGVELRRGLPTPPRLGVLQALAFVDAGRVQIHRDPWTDDLNVRSLVGAGVGLAWTWRTFSAEVSGAVPLDADGGHRPPQWWFRIAWAY